MHGWEDRVDHLFEGVVEVGLAFPSIGPDAGLSNFRVYLDDVEEEVDLVDIGIFIVNMLLKLGEGIGVFIGVLG